MILKYSISRYCSISSDLAGPEVIKFGIESKHSSALTSTSLFKAAVTQALLDMKLLFLYPQAAQAKL